MYGSNENTQFWPVLLVTKSNQIAKPTTIELMRYSRYFRSNPLHRLKTPCLQVQDVSSQLHRVTWVSWQLKNYVERFSWYLTSDKVLYGMACLTTNCRTPWNQSKPLPIQQPASNFFQRSLQSATSTQLFLFSSRLYQNVYQSLQKLFDGVLW